MDSLGRLRLAWGWYGISFFVFVDVPSPTLRTFFW
jgi:hypothetical protein